MGGSMGTAVGEGIVCAAERSGPKQTLPSLFVPASGGARMQEGMLSLMQNASHHYRSRYGKRKKDYPILLSFVNPTTGGVSASFAMVGDVHIAEPGGDDWLCRTTRSLKKPYAKPCLKTFKQLNTF